MANNQSANNVKNAAVLVQHTCNNTGRAGKNVNIDKFKLGDEDIVDGAACASTSGACASTSASCSAYDEPPEEPEPGPSAKFVDVNVFQDIESPSKEKNNAKLAELLRKTNKANIDVVINNTAAAGIENNLNAEAEKQDEEENPKVLPSDGPP